MKRSAFRAVLYFLVIVGGACQAVFAEDGAAIFSSNCVACHQAGGVGAPGLAPSLAGTLGSRIAGKDGREYLAQILITGFNGPIKSRGQDFNGFMPSFAQLPDADLAAVLNHVLKEFNGQDLPAEYKPLTPEEFTIARQKKLAIGAVRMLRVKSEPEAR